MDKRTPEQYAIEHAEYLALSAERLLNSLNRVSEMEEVHEERPHDQSEQDLCEALETQGEAMSSLQSRVYEFRKRAERARSDPATSPTGNGGVDEREALEVIATWPITGKPSENMDAHNMAMVARAALSAPSLGIDAPEQPVGVVSGSTNTGSGHMPRVAWVFPPQSGLDDCPLPVGTKLYLAPQQARDVWRPIETAPRDGTEVLLLGKKGRIANGKWGQPDGWANPLSWVWPYINAEPTHWQPPLPLPAAPKGDGT